MTPRTLPFLSIAVLLCLALAACTPTLQPQQAAPSLTPTATTQPTATPVPPTDTPVPPTNTPEPTATPDAPPPDAQRIEFTTSDGGNLIGLYYPAAVEPAPIVVLMHQAGATRFTLGKELWFEAGFAQWLQNRGVGGGAFGDDLLPPLPDDLALGVFTFDYRSFGESDPIAPTTDPRPLWVADSIAALETAKSLPGADPAKIIAIGGSIGADGAPIACAEVAGCLGALSFSPGSFLDRPYTQAVKAVDDQQLPVYCLAAQNDRPSPDECQRASGNRYKFFIFPGSEHGVEVFKPGLDPSPGQVTIDFLLDTLGLVP